MEFPFYTQWLNFFHQTDAHLACTESVAGTPIEKASQPGAEHKVCPKTGGPAVEPQVWVVSDDGVMHYQIPTLAVCRVQCG